MGTKPGPGDATSARWKAAPGGKAVTRGKFGRENRKNVRAAIEADREGCPSGLETRAGLTGFCSKAALHIWALFLAIPNILPLPMFLSSALDADPAFHVVQTQDFFGCQGLCVTCRLWSVCILDHKGTENAAQNVYGIFRPRQICSALQEPQSEQPGEAGEAAPMSAAGNRAGKPPAFSQQMGTTWLERAKKDLFGPFLKPARNRMPAGWSPNPPRAGRCCRALGQSSDRAAASATGQTTKSEPLEAQTSQKDTWQGEIEKIKQDLVGTVFFFPPPS